MRSELNTSFFLVGCSSKSASKYHSVCGFQIRLLSMLEEYTILRQEKEQERRRQRVMSSNCIPDRFSSHKTFNIVSSSQCFETLSNIFFFTSYIIQEIDVSYNLTKLIKMLIFCFRI